MNAVRSLSGINVFRFGYGGANNFMGFNWVNLDPFYSRRIGRTPQGRIPESPFSEAPQGVRILGAAKLTGRLGSWNVGTLSALTQREHARLSDGTVEQRAEIEPLAGYGVVRAQRDFAGGRHGLGVLGTVTHRDFRDNSLRDQMDAGAQLAGLDGWLTLDSKRTWVMSGWGAISRVTGTAARITALQAGAGTTTSAPTRTTSNSIPMRRRCRAPSVASPSTSRTAARSSTPPWARCRRASRRTTSASSAAPTC
jgi:hypothetical protein